MMYTKKYSLTNKNAMDSILHKVSHDKVVLMGEASHGTHEYYDYRCKITKKLVQNGFNFIAVEGDWPDCFRINQFVKGDLGYDITAVDMLKQFNRWPTWMWGNEEIAEFIEWLRGLNSTKLRSERICFYGLDLYCMFQSLDQIIQYLKGKGDSSLLRQALKAQKCYQRYRSEDRVVPFISTECSNDILELLKKMTQVNSEQIDDEYIFCIEQNAKTILDAEKYYTSMYIDPDFSSWNVRGL